MTEFDLQKEDYGEEWKETLRDAFFTAIIGDNSQKAEAYHDIGYYYKCCAPAYLYKYYRPSPINFDAIRNSKMWYSAPCNFNDVFDCDIHIDEDAIFKSTLLMIPDNRQIRPGSQMWRELKGSMRRECRQLKSNLELLKETMGISCLSESDNSLLMWAHYADNHHGICVEYNLLDINQQLNFSPVPVVYSNNKPFFDSINVETIEQDSLKLLIQSITSKSPEWEYEKEWRIIRDDKSCGDNWDKKNKGALLDMIRPSSIILGCQAEPAIEEKFEKYCNANKVNLYRMEKDESQYSLNKKSVLKFDSD